MMQRELADRVWNILGKRWTLSILKSMGSRDFIRFGELKKSLAGVGNTMLSERLQELEREGLVAKRVHSSAPPKVEYSLTASARELDAIVNYHALKGCGL